jgi:hypothetical protein
MQGRRSLCSRPGLLLLDTHDLKGTLKPLTPGHHLRLHRKRAGEEAGGGHTGQTRGVGPRETPRFFCGRGPVRLSLQGMVLYMTIVLVTDGHNSIIVNLP